MIVRAIVVVAEAAPVPETTTLYEPVGAVVEVESVSVVPHVAVQLEDENAAVTPDGNEAAENDTETELPVSRVAVIPSVAEAPCVTESVELAADSEMVDGTTVGAAVLNV